MGIGGVLSQADAEGRERVIAYGSRLLTKPERRYCVTRRELLAVVTFIQHYRPYLVCHKFTLRTDHGSLTWLRNFKEPEGQLARWLEQLQELDFEIIHRPGRAHQNADSLSRLPCRQCGRPAHDEYPTEVVAVTSFQFPGTHTSETLQQLQRADPVLGPLIQGKETGVKPGLGSFTPVSKAVRRFLQIWDQLLVHEGVLCRQALPSRGSPGGLQVVIPASLKQEVLADLHEGVVGGHLGADKTLGRLRERFYWPGHYTDVRDWCHNCSVCASRKTPAPKARAPLQSIVTSRPLELVATDILGPLPESPAGNSYILVVADYFTRYTEAYPLPNQEATTVARQLVDEFFLRFAPPERLHSDQGRNFESAVIVEACKLLGIDKSRTTPYHPQSDGLVERFNRTLLNMLSTAVNDQPFQWEQNLRRLCFAYNTSVHPTTGFTPFSLMFGRQARMPLDIVLGAAPSPSATTAPEYVADLQSSLTTAYEHVRNRMGQQLQQQKTHYDSKVQGRPFQVGDLVWLHNPAVKRGQSRKLHRPWSGPLKVLSRLSDTTYRLQHVREGRRKPVVHYNRLKPCSPNVRLPTSSPPRRTQGRGMAPLPTPVVGRLELVEDDEMTPLTVSSPQRGSTPQLMANSPPSSRGRRSREADSHVTTPTPPTPPEPPPPPRPRDRGNSSRRYPQRERSAPVRLYKVIEH